MNRQVFILIWPLKKMRWIFSDFILHQKKKCLNCLKSVNGIGPKLALSILSGIPIEELKSALQDGNIGRIVAVPGIGRKTAERLLVELRDKVEKVAQDVEFAASGISTVRKDAVIALTTLGYNQKTAEKAVRELLQKDNNL